MLRQFRILANYGFGWEEVDSTDDELTANNLLEQYREDEPMADFMLDPDMDMVGEDDED